MAESIAALLRFVLPVSLIASLNACSAPFDLITTARSAPAVMTTPLADWRQLAPGLAWRTLLPNDDEIAQISVLRIDPAQYRFRAIYRPGAALRLSQWQALEPDAIAIINANFFDTAYRALGLVISDGLAFGAPYINRGGTFAVENDRVDVRSFRTRPVSSVEALEQAVQGFPLLVENGKQAFFNQTSKQRTRRTVIAVDTAGNILILVAPYLGLSLAELSAYLPQTDLNIQTAINLDGGGSTMFALRDIDYSLPSFDAVPTILAVYRR